MAVTFATLSTASSIDLDGTNLGLVGGVAVIGLLALVLGVVLRGQVLTAGDAAEALEVLARREAKGKVLLRP